jgi:glutathione synthase/RimK-type ligase-like ATP-grasp enzyme
MMKVLILTRFRGEYEPRRLAEEAVELGYKVDKVNYEHVRLGVSRLGKPIVDLGTGRKLEEYDLIVPRAATKRGGPSMLGVKSVILEYIENKRTQELKAMPAGRQESRTRDSNSERKSVKVINGESFKHFPLMGKLEQGVLLAQAGLPVIPFTSFNGVRGWKRYLEILNKRKKEFVPVMVKARFGSHGKNVKLAESLTKLNKLAIKYSEGDVLIQPVLKVRRWYRVLILNGKVLGTMKHRQKDRFQVLAHQEELAKIKPRFSKDQMKELEKLSLEAVRVLKADFAGLDVAWDEESGQWRILEVNRTAQFKWFEKAFPEVNVAERIVRVDG